MSSNVKNAVFGTKQKLVLTPDVGYEVEAVEVFNKTTNEVVPSLLEKTSENPPQWTCSFQQPAGLISIRPKMKQILYSVIIEECENCNIVLLEYDDAVDIKVGVSAFEQPEVQQPSSEENSEDGVNFNQPQHSANDEDNAAVTLNVGGNDASDAVAPIPEEDNAEVEVNTAENTVHSEEEASIPDEPDGDIIDAVVEGPGDETEVKDEDNTGVEAGAHDSIYDAGEFEDELQEVEPEIISGKTRDKKNDLYWQHRKAYDAGQITKEKFLEVQKKHMQFLDDIAKGKIIVKE